MDDDDREAAYAGDDDSERLYDRWEFERLVAAAQGGSLSAAREVLRKAVGYTQHVLSQQPEKELPYLRDWMIEFLWTINKYSDQPVEKLISPPTGGNRPKGDALAIDSLRQDAHMLVHSLRADGMGTKVAFDQAAAQLNARGYRNSKDEPLTGSVVKNLFYDECKCGGAASDVVDF